VTAEVEGDLLFVALDTEYSSGLGLANPFFTKVSVFNTSLEYYLIKNADVKLNLVREYLIPGVVTHTSLDGHSKKTLAVLYRAMKDDDLGSEVRLRLLDLTSNIVYKPSDFTS
jgi:hypothetical protein